MAKHGETRGRTRTFIDIPFLSLTLTEPYGTTRNHIYATPHLRYTTLRQLEHGEFYRIEADLVLVAGGAVDDEADVVAGVGGEEVRPRAREAVGGARLLAELGGRVAVPLIIRGNVGLREEGKVRVDLGLEEVDAK